MKLSKGRSLVTLPYGLLSMIFIKTEFSPTELSINFGVFKEQFVKIFVGIAFCVI